MALNMEFSHQALKFKPFTVMPCAVRNFFDITSYSCVTGVMDTDLNWTCRIQIRNIISGLFPKVFKSNYILYRYLKVVKFILTTYSTCRYGISWKRIWKALLCNMSFFYWALCFAQGSEPKLPAEHEKLSPEYIKNWSTLQNKWITHGITRHSRFVLLLLLAAYRT
jgi:hypothetical protein